MIMIILLTACFLFFAASQKAGAAECQLTCPEYFLEGEENTVTCRINRTAIDNKCVELHASPHLMFTTKSKDNNYPLCIYSTSSDCGVCKVINDGLTNCIYKVAGNRSLEGGDLECKVCALWKGNQHEANEGICLNVKLVNGACTYTHTLLQLFVQLAVIAFTVWRLL